MAGEMLRHFPGRWPALADWFEDVPVELRSAAGGHPVRIEESEENGTYVVRAELPGIDPERDVEITLDDDVLTVHAERKEEKKEKYRSEFRYGSFTRSVRLPGGISAEDITANYADGVLTVRAPVPKEEPTTRRRIEVTRNDEHAA